VVIAANGAAKWSLEFLWLLDVGFWSFIRHSRFVIYAVHRLPAPPFFIRHQALNVRFAFALARRTSYASRSQNYV
jgi:hypothetical protein